jgi:hypothetical protein
MDTPMTTLSAWAKAGAEEIVATAAIAAAPSVSLRIMDFMSDVSLYCRLIEIALDYRWWNTR